MVQGSSYLLFRESTPKEGTSGKTIDAPGRVFSIVCPVAMLLPKKSQAKITMLYHLVLTSL